MTTREPDNFEQDPGWSYHRRDFPPCSCKMPGCSGSDHTVRIVPRYDEQDPKKTHIKPLSNPYKAELGALVLDVLNGRVGVLVDRRRGTAVFLRGDTGYEWETDSRFLERPPAGADPQQVSESPAELEPDPRPCSAATELDGPGVVLHLMPGRPRGTNEGDGGAAA